MAALIKTCALVLSGLLAVLPAASHAHRVWLLPSQTVLSQTGGWITVDGAASNDLFFYTWYPLQLNDLAVTAPDGSEVAPQNLWRGKSRSSFELELKQSGTHRIAVYTGVLLAQYEIGGEQKRWSGPVAQFATAVPATAGNLSLAFDEYRIESFVTVGRITPIKTLGKGLELAPVTHPNDLVAGEGATFKFLLDGQPAAGLDVLVVAGNTRYRDNQDEIRLKTGADGSVTIQWPAAGMYWLEVGTQDEKSPVPQARKRYATYFGTFEVHAP